MKDILESLEPKEKKGRELELLTPEEMVDHWVASIESDIDRPLTTCIPSFDKDLRNKLRGTVGAYIGYGGTKKSLLALQACKKNVLTYENKCTGVYSNMEMGIFQWMSRLMDMSFVVDGYERYNASYTYEYQYEQAFRNGDRKLLDAVKKVLKESFRELYGKNLYVNSQSNMSIDDFDSLLRKAKEKNGTIDMLVIDGLSMMSGVGSETETYTTNSKELKELAKMYNVYIPLICHLSKGADKHTRDTQRFIRGSEKILDNVDFVIMMSLVVDVENSASKSVEYLKDEGYIRFFNKRGSGNTVNVVYEFDSKRLEIKETDKDPKMADVEFRNF